MIKIISISNSLKAILRLVCVGMLGMILLTSCNKSPDQANYIPKDASVVVSIDVKSLGLKSMGFKDIFSINNLKKVLSKSDLKDTSINNIKDSGIDLLSNAYIFGSMTERNGGYGAAIIALSDKGKFEAYSKKLIKQATITSEGEYKLATSTSEPNSIILWNSKTAVLLYQSPQDVVQIKDRALSILNLKKEESLAINNSNFENFLKESSDVSVWVNFEGLSPMAKRLGANTVADTWKDNYMTMNCNFNNGQIAINSKYYANKETSEKFDLAKGTVTKETSTLIPAESLIGLFGISLDMNKVYSVLEKEQFVSMVEEQAGKSTGMSVKDLFQIFNGQIAASFNGVYQKELTSYDVTTGNEEIKKETLPQFALVLGINDRNKCAQLLSSLSEKGFLTQEENTYTVKNLYSLIDLGSYLVLVPENQKDAILNKTNKKLSPENEEILTQNAASFYLNFTNISESTLEMLNPTQREMLKRIPLESVVVSSEALKDKVSNGKCLITLKEKEQNSLITLAKYSDEVSKLEEVQNPSLEQQNNQNENVQEGTPEEGIMENEVHSEGNSLE